MNDWYMIRLSAVYATACVLFGYAESLLGVLITAVLAGVCLLLI